MPWYSGYRSGFPMVASRDAALAMGDAYFTYNPQGAVQYFVNQGGGYWVFVRSMWLNHQGEWLLYNYPPTSGAYQQGGTQGGQSGSGGGSGYAPIVPPPPPPPAPPPPPPSPFSPHIEIPPPPVDVPPGEIPEEQAPGVNQPQVPIIGGHYRAPRLPDSADTGTIEPVAGAHLGESAMDAIFRQARIQAALPPIQAKYRLDADLSDEATSPQNGANWFQTLVQVATGQIKPPQTADAAMLWQIGRVPASASRKPSYGALISNASATSESTRTPEVLQVAAVDVDGIRPRPFALTVSLKKYSGHVLSVSWIPSGSLSGWPTYGIGEDTVTPRDTDSTVSLEWAKKKANEYREIRFYNYLHAWIEVEQSGKIVKYDFYEDSDGENNEEWLGAGSVAYDTIRDKKYFAATKDKPDCVAFRQIVGGRTSRPGLTAIIGALLASAPFALLFGLWVSTAAAVVADVAARYIFQFPPIWTVLEIRLYSNGDLETSVIDHSFFPRHRKYAPVDGSASDTGFDKRAQAESSEKLDKWKDTGWGKWDSNIWTTRVLSSLKGNPWDKDMWF